MKRYDSKTVREVLAQLRLASVRNRRPATSQNGMRWWNIAGVSLYLLNKIEELERKVDNLEGRVNV